MTEQLPPSGSTPPPGFTDGGFSNVPPPAQTQASEPTYAPREDGPSSIPSGLWLGAALFVVATAIVIFKGADGDSAYGIGELVGISVRNLLLGLLVALLTNFLIRRSRNQPASWKPTDLKSIDGAALALGGGAALVLALALGVPGGSAATGVAAARGCPAGELSPIDNVAAPRRSEISEDEFAAAFGSRPASGGQFYSLGKGPDEAVVGIVPGANADAELATAGEAEGQRGLAPQTVQVGAVSAIKFSSPQHTSYLAKSGCSAVVIAASSASAADQWATTLLATATK